MVKKFKICVTPEEGETWCYDLTPQQAQIVLKYAQNIQQLLDMLELLR